jgi:hypothetical protein
VMSGEYMVVMKDAAMSCFEEEATVPELSRRD